MRNFFKLTLAIVFFNLTAIIPINANSRVVLWNTLDSESAIENSKIGQNGFFGEGSFEEGLFGTAYSIDYSVSSEVFPDLVTITFPKEVINIDSGTIEIWAKLENFPYYLGHGGSSLPFPYLLHIDDGYSSWKLGLNSNDGASNGGLCGTVGHGFLTGSGYFGSWSHEQVLGSGQTEKWHHYALVWDRDGITGIDDGTRKVAVFLDGQLESGRWQDYYGRVFLGINEIVPLVGGELQLAVNWRSQGKIIVDNLVVWDDAITDFSHRFTENPNDDDNDGISNEEDYCISTPPGEIVDVTGCSISQLCPCINQWKNHGAYVRCIAQTSESFVFLGLITENEKDKIVSQAGKSSCGMNKPSKSHR